MIYRGNEINPAIEVDGAAGCLCHLESELFDNPDRSKEAGSVKITNNYYLILRMISIRDTLGDELRTA